MVEKFEINIDKYKVMCEHIHSIWGIEDHISHIRLKLYKEKSIKLFNKYKYLGFIERKLEHGLYKPCLLPTSMNLPTHPMSETILFNRNTTSTIFNKHLSDLYSEMTIYGREGFDAHIFKKFKRFNLKYYLREERLQKILTKVK